VLQLQKNPELRESEITLISEGTQLEGTIEFASVTRVHGRIKGKLIGLKGSLVVLGQQSHVEGTLDGDQLWIEGFVRGKISCITKVILASTARVIADIEAPSIEIEPGAYFEGSCKATGSNPDAGTTQPSA